MPPKKKGVWRCGQIPAPVGGPDKASLSAFDNIEDDRQSNILEVTKEKTKRRGIRAQAKMSYHFPLKSASFFSRVSTSTGLLVEERILADTKRADEKHPHAVPMGKMYWDERRKEYEDPMDATEFEKLVIHDENEPEDAVMKNALSSFMRNVNKTEDLTDWSEMCQSMNQKNFVCLLKAMWHINPGQTPGVAKMVCNVMRMIARLGLEQKYKAEFEVVRTYFDLGLKK